MVKPCPNIDFNKIESNPIVSDHLIVKSGHCQYVQIKNHSGWYGVFKRVALLVRKVYDTV